MSTSNLRAPSVAVRCWTPQLRQSSRNLYRGFTSPQQQGPQPSRAKARTTLVRDAFLSTSSTTGDLSTWRWKALLDGSITAARSSSLIGQRGWVGGGGDWMGKRFCPFCNLARWGSSAETTRNCIVFIRQNNVLYTMLGCNNYNRTSHGTPISSECWKTDAHIWLVHGDTLQDSIRYTSYLEDYWPCAGGLSAVDTIGTQMRRLVNSGLARWLLTMYLDAVAENGRNPVSKYHILPGCGE